jgi:hypothetical protein
MSDDVNSLPRRKSKLPYKFSIYFQFPLQQKCND